VKHLVKPECRHGCRFLQITPALWLCEHASYGEASYLVGAVEDARAMLEKAGGYNAVLAKIVKEEEKKSAERQEERIARGGKQVRYG
jgi:hypothetical protein